ncbi:MAG: hypothetical protein Q8O19_03185, partial [Rectinemataceae bacterium]|nr:hypothetical protein [Rectinemataceae bacterium]
MTKSRFILAAAFFVFILAAHFRLNDYSAYLLEKQWGDVPFSHPFETYLSSKNIFLGYAYALSGAFAVLCLFNLITTSGDLRKSIRGITISTLIWAGVCFFSGCCGSPMLAIYISIFGGHIVGLTKPLMSGITTASIGLSFYYVMRFHGRNLFAGRDGESSSDAKENPFSEIKVFKEQWLPRRAFSHFLMTLFRLFPNPAPMGLYRFGKPDRRSPVFLTSNYVLTLDRVAAVIKGMDCYLLVADGKGVNVWCSAGAGYFNEDRVADAVRLSGIAGLVDHRRIILPQFAAVGVCKFGLQEKIGWSFDFGPAYIEDLPKYVKNGFCKDAEMRSARFGLKQRIEMATGSTIMAIAALACVMVFINPHSLLFLIPLIYLQAILFA